MPPTLPWLAGDDPVAPAAHAPVLRFGGKKKHRVWLLADPRRKWSHFAFGRNSVPCLAKDPHGPAAAHDCPFCGDAEWKGKPLNLEGFAPVLYRDPKATAWTAAVAVFTKRGLDLLGAGPHRGKVLDVWKHAPNGGTSSPMHIAGTGRLVEIAPGKKEPAVEVVEPPIPAFDIDPHLLAMWFPFAKQEQPAYTPPPVPFAVQAPPPPPPAEPFRMTDEAKALLRSKIALFRGGPAGEPADADPRLSGELAVTATAADPKNYGPRLTVVPAATPEGDEAAANRGTARLLGDDLRAMPYLNGKHHHANTNGGAK